MINTIGYEAADIHDFLQTLKEVDISVLIDVRDRAQSRRKGFSKTALSEALAAEGIEYLHLPELGDPKPGREAARAGNFRRFRQIYRRVLASDEAKHAIKTISSIAAENNICLLCYERDPKTCHRTMITDKMVSETGVIIRHLGVRKFEQAA